MTQAGMLEHLKLENVALSQQLTETQHRSIKEKERIAAQLQNIEVWLYMVFVSYVLSRLCIYVLQNQGYSGKVT